MSANLLVTAEQHDDSLELIRKGCRYIDARLGAGLHERNPMSDIGDHLAREGQAFLVGHPCGLTRSIGDTWIG